MDKHRYSEVENNHMISWKESIYHHLAEEIRSVGLSCWTLPFVNGSIYDIIQYIRINRRANRLTWEDDILS